MHVQIYDNGHGSLLRRYEEKGTIEETLTTRRINTSKKVIVFIRRTIGPSPESAEYRSVSILKHLSPRSICNVVSYL
jgi:hypothetical protein